MSTKRPPVSFEPVTTIAPGSVDLDAFCASLVGRTMLIAPRDGDRFAEDGGPVDVLDVGPTEDEKSRQPLPRKVLTIVERQRKKRASRAARVARRRNRR